MRSASRQHAGFTLVEVAVVAGILGLLALTMTSAFEGMEQARVQNRAQADAEAARQALRHFLLRNKRLPCPDNSSYGDRGREAGGSGSCPGGLDTGWLPYESLGLQLPVRAQRLRYGVHRGSGADLVAPTPGAIDGLDLEGSAGLTSALSKAASTTPSSSFPYYAATVTSAGTTCGGGDLVNPAFVLVAPATDRDADGGTYAGFDAPNLGFAAGSAKCFAAPARPASIAYDDVVVAESSSTLLGWFLASTR
jgi:prepilin-type N-terminal cleavage/methylation domain-containing protein